MECGDSQHTDIDAPPLHSHLHSPHFQTDMPGIHRGQHPEPHIRHSFRMPHLQTLILQLRQDDSRRPLRQSDEFRAVHRRLQFARGPDHRPFTYADAVFPANADKAQGGNSYNFCHGLHVSQHAAPTTHLSHQTNSNLHAKQTQYLHPNPSPRTHFGSYFPSPLYLCPTTPKHHLGTPVLPQEAQC